MSDFSKSYFLLAYFLLPILGFILDLFQILTWFFKFYKVSTEPKAYKKLCWPEVHYKNLFWHKRQKKSSGLYLLVGFKRNHVFGETSALAVMHIHIISD